MSPLERQVAIKIAGAADMGWTCRIRALAVESIVCQMHTTTTATTIWSVLPRPAQRRMRAAVKGNAGVRLSLDEVRIVAARLPRDVA